MSLSRLSYDYCKIFEKQDGYLVEYGYRTYNGKEIYPPVKIGNRIFSTEKKARRYAKKISAIECLKSEN